MCNIFDDDEKWIPSFNSLGAKTWFVNNLLYESSVYNDMLFEFVKPPNTRHTTFNGLTKYYKNVDRKRTN